MAAMGADDDEILADFTAENPLPRAGDVERWSALHPHLADRFLQVGMALHRFGVGAVPAPTPTEIEASWRRHEAIAAGIRRRQSETPRLSDLALTAGTDLAAAADGIEIDRRILSGLDAGRIMPPVPMRLVEALAGALASTATAISEALDASFATPHVAFARSEGTPSLARIRYAAAVQASNMPDERKAYWTGED